MSSSGRTFSVLPTVLLSLALGVVFGVIFLLLFNPAVKRNNAAQASGKTVQTASQSSTQSGQASDATAADTTKTGPATTEEGGAGTTQTATAVKPREYKYFTGQTGAELYVEVCQSCHMPGGKGAKGGGGVYNYPNLAGNAKLATAPYVTSIVMNGNGGMPGFAHYLSDEQAAKIVNYVRMELNDNKDEVKPADIKNVRPAEDKELTFGEAAG